MMIEIPMVMIIIRRMEGLISQRIKITSMSAPTTMVMTTATTIASGRGMKRFKVTAVSEHHKFALGEIDDPRGVVDDIEPDRDDGVDDAIGYAGNQILE